MVHCTCVEIRKYFLIFFIKAMVSPRLSGNQAGLCPSNDVQPAVLQFSAVGTGALCKCFLHSQLMK